MLKVPANPGSEWSKAIINSIPDPAWLKDPEGRFVAVNAAWCHFIGIESAAAVGKTNADVFPAEIAGVLSNRDLAAMRTRRPQHFEESLVHADGRLHWFETTISPLVGPDDTVLGVTGIARDITVRKLAEDGLRQQMSFREGVIKRAAEGLCVCHAIAEFPFVKFTVWNDRMVEMTGYTLEEINRLGWYQTMYPDPAVRDRAIHRMEQMRDGVDILGEEWEITRADGDRRVVSISTSLLVINDHERHVLALMQDVTQRKRADETLRRNERFIQSIAVASPLWLYVFDFDQQDMTYVNRSILSDLGYSVEVQAATKGLAGLTAFMPAEEMPHLQRLLAEWQGLPDGMIHDDEYYLRHVDGEYRTYAGRETVFQRRPDGTVKQVLGTLLDITDRKRAVQSLQISEERLRRAAQAANFGTYHFDFETFETYWSPELRQIFGLGPDEPIRFDKDQVPYGIYPDDQAAVAAVLNASSNSITGGIANIEHRIVRPDGAIRWVAVRGRVEFIGDGDRRRPIRAAGTVVDVTERKQAEQDKLELERRLLHSQKLESLGVLAGGIAHDFNNILAGILGFADLALDHLSPNDRARADIDIIKKAALRAADLTKQMLAYTGKGKFQFAPVNLSTIAQEIWEMLQVSITKKATLVCNLPAELPTIRADASQLHQVLLNLVINAAEAIGEQPGVITISTGVGEITAADKACLVGDCQSGPCVFLEVVDTGCGMKEEVLAKIFDPFYTTKFTGRGLGLAAVHGIVRGHQGALKVTSRPGQGTTFRLYFPVIAETPVTVESAPVAVATARGAGLVLIVDDEEVVRTMTAQMLKLAGFDTVLAANGAEAVEIFRTQHAQIACVLLDLTMPKKSGLETLRELREISSTVPVVLSSGYSEEGISDQFAGLAYTGFLQKPYRREKLVATVKDAIASQST